MACVYIFRHGKENKFKIGRSKKSAQTRLKELQTGNPDLTIFDVIETEYDTKVENYMHRRLATKKIINGSRAAIEALMLVAEHGGPTMMARIGMVRALYRHHEPPAPTPRKKQAKKYRVVR